ncbi:PEP-CTERM sorting domain-containing protein [Planctomycetota bacterium]
MMRNFIFALIVIAFATTGAFGSLIEVDIEIDPVIDHHWIVIPPEQMMDNYLTDAVLTNPPDVTLASGDVYRLNVSFTDGKMLKLINNVSHVEFFASFKYDNGGRPSGPSEHYGNIEIDITNSAGVLNTTKSTTPALFADADRSYIHFLAGSDPRWQNDAGEIADGSLFGDFTLEFTTPTTEYTFSARPFDVRLNMKAFSDDNSYDRNLFEIVPEPATVLLLSFGGLFLRRKQKQQ